MLLQSRFLDHDNHTADYNTEFETTYIDTICDLCSGHHFEVSCDDVLDRLSIIKLLLTS